VTVTRSQRALKLGCEHTLTPHARLSRTTRGLCADGHRRDRNRGRRPGYDSGHQHHKTRTLIYALDLDREIEYAFDTDEPMLGRPPAGDVE